MLVVLSGGGTAGHINPALALGSELAARGVQLHFAGTPKGAEAQLAIGAGMLFTPFEAQGFNRRHPLSLPRALAQIRRSTIKAEAWFEEIRPDAVVAFGGYVCVPVGRAALRRGVPVVVHEQNSVMGLANRYLARKAAAVCLSYEQAASALGRGAPVKLTGNPVRPEVLAATRAQGRARFGVPPDALMLLVTGGSLGARHLNQALAALKPALLAHENLYVVHVCGPRELEAAPADLALSPEQQGRWQVFGYLEQMGQAMAAADLIVSRAGASSLAEISARALPALLVPYPHATGDHQTMNARALVQEGCALLVADAELEGPAFERGLLGLVEDEGLRQSMARAARARKAEGAAGLLADAVMEAARAGRPGAGHKVQ